MSTKLSRDYINQRLTTLAGWVLSEDQNSISKTFTFENFNEAWSIMSQIAEVAEEMDHHPNWSNVYNILEISLNTHTCAGVTELDLKLAREINRIVGE